MDPLFGFIDDLSAQHHQQQPESTAGVGEYTISYPAEQQQSEETFQLQNTNAPQLVKAATTTSTEPVPQIVHVVSETSQSEKKVYVIKLANFLKDNGNPEDSTIRFEGAEVEGANETAPEPETKVKPVRRVVRRPTKAPAPEPKEQKAPPTPESSSSEEDDDDVNIDQEADAGPGPDPFLVVSPEAVMAMAQSVGVELNEDDASELGCIAINKLRNAVLIAMQFAQNENSEGITVEHFSKAEAQLGSRGVGQGSIFREAPLKYVGGVSIIDDGPEIDLYACLKQENISEIQLDETDPVLNVHHLRSHDTNYHEDEASEPSNMDTLECDEPEPDIAECRNEYTMINYQTDSDDEDSSEVKLESPNATEEEAPKQPTEDGENNAPSEKVKDDDKEEDSETSSEEEIKQALNEMMVDDDEVNEAGEEHEEIDSETKSINVAPEWMTYLQMLIEQIVEHNNNQLAGCGMSADFRRILRDIRKHGLHPIFPILCDTFRDYLKESVISRSSIMNILCIVDALVSSCSEPSPTQMSDLGSVMIEVIILPPPGDIYQYLTHVFMKILKKCNELLTWTCTYITEILKGISDAPFDQLQESFKSAMQGALCLANGLEEIHIQVAHQFGWHTSILNFSASHSSVFDGQSYMPTTQDSFLEEAILKFYYNFMKNYTNLVTSIELSKIGECINTHYGERFVSYAPPAATVNSFYGCNDSPQSVKIKSASTSKTRCIFRKIVYKDKEIIVPYRKVIK